MKAALGITAVIALLGIIGGVIGGVLVVGVFVVAKSIRLWTVLPMTFADFAFLAAVASVFGVLYGVVLGPFLSWTLLRKAPLWRAVGETTRGAALGAGLSVALLGLGMMPFVVAFAAALAAATRLHLVLERSGAKAALPR